MTIKETFHNAKTYSVYYGKDCLEELQRYDIVIIEPMAHKIPAIADLRKRGIVVFAYLSVVEAHPEQIGSHLRKENLLTVQGEPLTNDEYQTYYADIRSEEWLKHLYKKAETYLKEYQCDGLFLDTIGNLEDPRIPVNIKYDLIETAVTFLENIKKRFNQSLLIQNNGLGLLLQYTKDYVDGVCWENMSFRHGLTGRFNKVIWKKLKAYQTETGLKVFLLTEDSEHPGKAMKFARKNDFLYYNASKDYIKF